MPAQTLFRSSFPLLSSAVPSARLAVVDALREHDVPTRTLDAVALAASELCSNAVKAGRGQTFEVAVSVSPDTTGVELQVLNVADLDDIPERSTWRPTDRLAARGRGLSIVDTVAASFEFATVGERVMAIARFA